MEAPYGFSESGLSPAKRIKDPGSKKKRRKDKRNSSGRGLMEKLFSSRLMPTGQFLFKEMC